MKSKAYSLLKVSPTLIDSELDFEELLAPVSVAEPTLELPAVFEFEIIEREGK